MDKKIKLALICTSVNQLGGKNNHMRNLYFYLNQAGFQVTIICCSRVENELREFMFARGVRPEDLILLPRMSKWLIFPFIARLRRVLLKNKIDIVHTFQMQSDILGGISARLAGIKLIFACFESKIIEDNISHGKQFFYKTANRLIKNWFMKTVAISEGIRKELVEGGFRQADKIEVIHLGLPIPQKYRNYLPDYARIKDRTPVIATISRLDREKGVSRFIASMPLILREIPAAKFLITGKGEEEQGLRNQVNQLNLGNKVDFSGWVNDAYAIMENIDILVVPSIREGFGFILLEAFLFSKPVVASRIDGIKDVIDDGNDGILADAADPLDLSRAVISLCKDPDTAIAMGRTANEKLHAKFSIDREIEQYKNMYNRHFQGIGH